MPETVVLNANVGWDDDIRDAIGPDYGFSVREASTRVYAKPPGGRPYSREIQNAATSFQLSWLNRSFECMQRIRKFYNQYQDGFFTIIDHDGGGRHYVGRFVGDFPWSQRGNDSYDIQGLTFEVVPGAPMVEYPSDWTRDGVQMAVQNDFGDRSLATSGVWTSSSALGYSTLDSAGVAGDFATMEYRGYGYRLWMQIGPAFGGAQVYLDNVLVATLDLYQALVAEVAIVSTNTNVPLDLHRVKVVALHEKNGASSGYGISWAMLEVMR